MPGSLSTYWKKRDFGVTSEPRGEVARRGKRLALVVQKQAASRLHYDFRLEVDGTMVSWAVPKGPSLDPHVRRMAVHVEDRPISYNKFEGVIPAGQYGAGTVEVWDRGTWLPLGEAREGLRRGKLKFELSGAKLRGRWTLVRIDKSKDERHEPWLLIKENDEEARLASEFDIVAELPESMLKKQPTLSPLRGSPAGRGRKATGIPAGALPAKLPLSLHPQLATLVEEPPRGKGWIYEVKFDGYRILARIDGDDIRLFTRNGNNWTPRMKNLRGAIAALGIASGWLDGEIVVLDAKGNPDFQALQNAFDASATEDIVFFAFDLPYFGGHDLRRVPCLERRALLEKTFESNQSARLRFSSHFEADAAQLLESACREGLEGLIGKRAGAPYVSKRSSTWIKLKCPRRQELVIGGHTNPKGTPPGFRPPLFPFPDAQAKL